MRFNQRKSGDVPARRRPHTIIPRSLALLLAASMLQGFFLAADEAGTDQWAARRAKLDERPKKIYAHYMVCYPIGRLGISPGYAFGHEAPKIRHDSTDPSNGFAGYTLGGLSRGYPLLPDGTSSLSPEESADLDIRRALRAGIDGFSFDVLPAPESQAFEHMDAMFKVAEEKDYPFEITWCLDNADKNPTVVEYILQKHGKSPKLARRDGKFLLMGYFSVFQALHHGTGVKEWSQRPEWKGKEVGTYAAFRMTPDGWRTYRSGFTFLEEKFKTPMYFHFDMGAFGHGTQHPIEPPPARLFTTADAVGVLAEYFDAVGCNLPGDAGANAAAMAQAVRSKGAEWAQPVMYQFESIRWNSRTIRPGTDMMRDCWQQARDNRSTLIQFWTWNDYTELTMLAPTTDTRYGILDLTWYFTQLWKTGEPPKTDHDRIYLIYNKYPHELSTYPFGTRVPWLNQQNTLEVATWLTESATVRLPGRTESWEAPAGLSWKQVPLQPGPVSAEIVRRNWIGIPRVDLRFDSPEPVSDKPYRDQHSKVCASTEDVLHWKQDFGDAPPAPIQRGEYGDIDGDGLPNWFEMYWFGKSLADWPSATAADPAADPDGDSLTNLQEFQKQTNPKVAAKYARGYTWDFLKRKGPPAVNPDLDEFDTPVWHYLHKYSMELPIAHDGNYWPCERYNWEPGDGVNRCRFAAWYNVPSPHARCGEFVHEWRTEGDGDSKRQSYRFTLSTGQNCLRVLAWESPVAGTVRFAWETDGAEVVDSGFHNGNNPVIVTLEHSRPQRELVRWDFIPKDGGQGVVEDIEVHPEDRIYFVATVPPPHNQHAALNFRRLSVELMEEASSK